MEEKRRELRVGLFMLLGVVLLVWMVFTFERFAFHRSYYTLYATFRYGGGIQKGTPVRIAGYDVGKVGVVDWDPIKQVIIATLKIDTKYAIKEDATLVVDSEGMLGEVFLEFTAGSPQARNLRNEVVVEGSVPPTLNEIKVEGMEMVKKMGAAVSGVETLIAEAEKFVKGLQETNKKLSEGLESMSEMALEIRKGDGMVHQLIYDRELYDRTNTLLESANQAAEQVAELAAKLEEDPSQLIFGNKNDERPSFLKRFFWYIFGRSARKGSDKGEDGGEGSNPIGRPGRTERIRRPVSLDEGPPETKAGIQEDKPSGD